MSVRIRDHADERRSGLDYTEYMRVPSLSRVAEVVVHFMCEAIKTYCAKPSQVSASTHILGQTQRSGLL